MVRATQTVSSSMKVLATSLENAPKPDSKIKAKVLVEPLGTNAKGQEKDSEMSSNDRLIRPNKEGSISPLLLKFLKVTIIPSLFPTHLAP